jgi:hypothetical protein
MLETPVLRVTPVILVIMALLVMRVQVVVAVTLGQGVKTGVEEAVVHLLLRGVRAVIPVVLPAPRLPPVIQVVRVVPADRPEVVTVVKVVIFVVAAAVKQVAAVAVAEPV